MEQEIAIQEQSGVKKKVIWTNILFFLVTTSLGLVGAPLYFFYHGISQSEALLFGFYLMATGFSITLGYHRLFSHVTFKASPLIRFLVLFFGAAAFEQSALRWASQHRDHHRYVDTDQDPYSIKKGFFYAHIGWLMFWEHPIHYENVKDLQQSRLIRHQHRFYTLWAGTSGILLPILIGTLTGHIVGAILFTVCARITLIYHSTWCINSVCHTFGKATYDIYSSAKDHWFAAFLTGGEGYHNYHHHFPGDYRNGVLWYQWDPTKWSIALLSRLGLASELKRVSMFRILAARLKTENQRIEDRLARVEHPSLVTMRVKLKFQYERLRQHLIDWEKSARDHGKILQQNMAIHTEARRQASLKNLEAHRRFKAALAGWKAIQSQPLAV